MVKLSVVFTLLITFAMLSGLTSDPNLATVTFDWTFRVTAHLAVKVQHVPFSGFEGRKL